MLWGFALWSVAELVLSNSFCFAPSLRFAQVTALRLWHSFVLCWLLFYPVYHSYTYSAEFFKTSFMGEPCVNLWTHLQAIGWLSTLPTKNFGSKSKVQYTPTLNFDFQLWGTRWRYLTGRWAFKGGGRYRKKNLLCQKCFVSSCETLSQAQGGGIVYVYSLCKNFTLHTV